ncbi:MAG: hypothetical protein GY754_04755, partial [bacterium]|nr:hypothetical protein [bacterium]
MTDKKYRLETTEDGTATIYADEFSEAMHSTSGAYEEALLKHIYPSKILDSPKKNLKVLDIGFGLGYNILALLMELSAKRPGTGLTIISFEKDRTYLPLLETIQFHDEKAPVYEIIKKAFKEGEYSENNLSIKIHFGDARESLRLLQETGFDALFQDPFSPSKNPELWSLE